MVARDAGYGPWAPLSVAALRAALADAPLRWWVAGGHALALHLGRSWRAHDDLDVGIVRTDAPALHAHLTGWTPSIAAAGRLTPWDGRPLVEADDENNIWWRRTPAGPWVLDVVVGSGDDEHWIDRRDPAVRVRWDDAVLRTSDGLPYLAPEIQLLCKSSTIRPKDQLDAEVTIPELGPARRAWLRDRLPSDHPWCALLETVG